MDLPSSPSTVPIQLTGREALTSLGLTPVTVRLFSRRPLFSSGRYVLANNFTFLAFFFLFFGLLCFFYLICSIRTNVVLVWILLTVTTGLELVAATFWYAAKGDVNTSHQCQIVGLHCVSSLFAEFYLLTLLFTGCWCSLVRLLHGLMVLSLGLITHDCRFSFGTSSWRS